MQPFTQTDYESCSDKSIWGFVARNLIELIYGVSAFGGNTQFPVAGYEAKQATFKKDCSE